jgi:hypothetical protein
VSLLAACVYTCNGTLLQDFEAALSIAEASTVEGDTPLPLDAALTIAQCGAATLDWRTVAEAYDVRALSTRQPCDSGIGTLLYT